MRLRTKNHATKASRASTCIFERESRTRHVGHSHVSQVRSSKKTSKSRFCFWLGGFHKTMCPIYKKTLPNSPSAHLDLHHNSLSHLAGKSRLFLFPERALSRGTYQVTSRHLYCTLSLFPISSSNLPRPPPPRLDCASPHRPP